MAANVICNPNLIFAGEVLVIPEPGQDLPRAGGGPYYIVRPGDSLWCLARIFNTTVAVLAANNQIRDPSRILAGTELLVINERPDPVALQRSWVEMGGRSCEELIPMQIHGIYYLGTFRWEALGRAAVPYLISLAGNPCGTVRYYAVLALGRIALNAEAERALNQRLNDEDPEVAALARLAIRRIVLRRQGQRKVHLTIPERITLYAAPSLTSTQTVLPRGTPVEALRWFIPSPSGEEGPRGGLQIYDRVRLTATGQVGYLPRLGFDEIMVV